MGLSEDDSLLTPGEVAAIFGVNPKTVTRWERVGKLQAIRTLGGHRRFRTAEVEALRREFRGVEPGSIDGDGADPTGDDNLLTPGEVAAIFGVNPKTVTRWERSGRLRAVRTLGGHRRFRAEEVQRLREAGRPLVLA